MAPYCIWLHILCVVLLCFVNLMYQSNRSFYIPPGQLPGHLNFWRLACSNFLPSGQKSRSNAPPISSEIPLLKDKFRLQSNTVHTFQREICHDDTFKLLLKTFWKSYSLIKAKFYLVNLSNLAKTEKKHRSISPEQEINPVQIPHPSKQRSNSPLPGHNAQLNARGLPGGGVLKLQFDRYIFFSFFFFLFSQFIFFPPQKKKPPRKRQRYAFAEDSVYFPATTSEPETGYPVIF